MPTIPDVTPGDLITAELMNQILHKIADLEGRVGTGTTAPVTVPLVVGQTLSQARAILLSPSQQLSIGAVLDVDGVTVDSILPANANRIVIMQMPSAGTGVARNASVSLVVSTAAQSTPPKPIISSLDKSQVPVAQPLLIQGDNFAVPSTDNTVTFDGAVATITGPGNSKQLFVKVPNNIPGAPVNPGDPSKSGVQIVVTRGGVSSSPFAVTIQAPIANAPTISTITPDPGVVLQPLVISGTGFSGTLNKNVVTFDDVAKVPGTVTLASPTSLTVTVPGTIPGLTQSNDFRTGVQIAVSNTDVPNATAIKSHDLTRS